MTTDTKNKAAGRHQQVMIAASLSRLPGIRMVLAQELVLRRLVPVLERPDFLVGEEQLIENWKEVAPEPYAEAYQRVTTELGEKLELPNRILVRLAAYRRAYAAFFGSETYRRLYELGGEAVLGVKLPSGGQVKIGQVVSVSYKFDGRRWPEFMLWRDTEQVVDLIENAIMPVHQSDSADQWKHACFLREEAMPFRKWNQSSHLPAILTSQVCDARIPPEGVTVRDGIPEAIFAGGAGRVIDLLQAIGISAFVTEPARLYLEDHADEIHASAENPKLLAIFETSFA